MKLVTYNRDDFVSCAVLTDKGLLDIPAIWPGPNPPRTIIDILQRGCSCTERISTLALEADIFISLETVKLLAPIPQPGKVIALAGNYSEHIAEASLKRGFNLGLSDSTRQTTVPRPFIMPTTTIIGPDDEIPWPSFSKEIDYEIELVVVIGKKAKCISPVEAPGHVAGYTICNDVSARSVTFKEARRERPWDEFYDWLNGKWADGFLPIGPFLLTADEVEDVQNLNLILKVNDKIRQQANTSQMIYPVADIVSFLSFIMTLESGDVIATGTPAGVAVATGNFLKGGDKIECSIDKLGTLKNKLSEKPDDFYRPLA
jgi:2-keto-4-pentenoate hydratase/2-oxohepta-3-ene-1,7-dioic acid hydratase in catechol pathway